MRRRAGKSATRLIATLCARKNSIRQEDDVSKGGSEKVFVAEHVLEVRYKPSGTFLDVRGSLADYVRGAKTFPHWKIDVNVITFRDAPNETKSEGAFVGYKSTGYVVYNPQTRNYFPDKASAFWKLILKNEQFEIPELQRFGCRTKVFIPSERDFDEINSKMYQDVFSEQLRSLLGGRETDLMFNVIMKDATFGIRIMGGPVKKDEARQYFSFDDPRFSNAGIFLDIDYSKSDGLKNDDVPKLLAKAVELTWQKAEGIATGLGH